MANNSNKKNNRNNNYNEGNNLPGRVVGNALNKKKKKKGDGDYSTYALSDFDFENDDLI